MCGLQFTTEAQTALTSGLSKVYQFQKPFDETDLLELDVNVKQMNIGKPYIFYHPSTRIQIQIEDVILMYLYCSPFIMQLNIRKALY